MARFILDWFLIDSVICSLTAFLVMASDSFSNEESFKQYTTASLVLLNTSSFVVTASSKSLSLSTKSTQQIWATLLLLSPEIGILDKAIDKVKCKECCS